MNVKSILWFGGGGLLGIIGVLLSILNVGVGLAIFVIQLWGLSALWGIWGAILGLAVPFGPILFPIVFWIKTGNPPLLYFILCGVLILGPILMFLSFKAFEKTESN